MKNWTDPPDRSEQRPLTFALQPETKSQILAVFVVFNHNQGTVLASLDDEVCMREAVIPLAAMFLFFREHSPFGNPD